MQTKQSGSRNWHHKQVPGGIALGEDFSFTGHLVMINPTCRTQYDHAFVLVFGAYGWTRVHVYADSLDDALEECAAYLADHAPGLITKPGSEEYGDLMREACEELELAWPIPKECDDLEPYWEAEESAMVDHTRTEAGWINDEWGIGLEDPTTSELYAFVCGK